MAGRRPNSSLVNRLHGTKGAVNQDQVTAPDGAPDKPEGLTAVASDKWDFIVDALTEAGTISWIDSTAIEMAARYAGHYADADAEVQKNGLVVPTKLGIKTNPSIRSRDDAARILKSYLESLGLTPASRSKVSMVTDPDAGGETLEDILAR